MHRKVSIQQLPNESNLSMPQTQTLAMLIAVMSMIAPSETTLAQQPTANRPNIILCMADDQGWSEVGYNGHDCLQTPVMDEMAGVGFRFDKFYTAAPNCGPTRGSIMTGRNATRFGQFAPTWAKRPEEITIAEILKGARLSHRPLRKVASWSGQTGCA